MQELMDPASRTPSSPPRAVAAAAPPSRASGQADLLVRARDGDEDAFAALVQRYRAPVYSYLSRCGVDPSDRDDLFQEVFVGVLTGAHRFEAHRPLHPWLFTIVANTTRSYFRKRRIRQLVFAEAGPSEHAEPRAATPDGERTAAAAQTIARLEAEIPRLPLRQREVLILACIEHLPLKQIARTLGLPLNTIKTHLRRARLSLARTLALGHAAEGSERQP